MPECKTLLSFVSGLVMKISKYFFLLIVINLAAFHYVALFGLPGDFSPTISKIIGSLQSVENNDVKHQFIETIGPVSSDHTAGPNATLPDVTKDEEEKISLPQVADRTSFLPNQFSRLWQKFKNPRASILAHFACFPIHRSLYLSFCVMRI